MVQRTCLGRHRVWFFQHSLLFPSFPLEKQRHPSRPFYWITRAHLWPICLSSYSVGTGPTHLPRQASHEHVSSTIFFPSFFHQILHPLASVAATVTSLLRFARMTASGARVVVCIFMHFAVTDDRGPYHIFLFFFLTLLLSLPPSLPPPFPTLPSHAFLLSIK